MAAGAPNLNERLHALLNALTVGELLEVMNLLRETERMDAAVFGTGDAKTTRAKASDEVEQEGSCCSNPKATKTTKAKASDKVKQQGSCCSHPKAKVKVEDPEALNFTSLSLSGGASGSGTSAPAPTPAASPAPANTPFAVPTWHGPFYAVRVSRQVGIFMDWGFVAPLILGVSGAIHKKFDSYWEALAFFHGGEVQIVP